MSRRASCVRHNPTHWKYQITCREYAALVARFGGRCDRCGEEARAAVIDHDHSMGPAGVRGMICSRCNSIVGAVEEGRRPEDDATTRYLAAPFHPRLLTVPGLRPPPDDAIPALVGVTGAAAILRTSRRRVLDLAGCGQLKGAQIDGAWVFRREVVEAARAADAGEAEPGKPS